jgi:uridine phosphorylase
MILRAHSPLAENDFDCQGVIEPTRVVPDVDIPERAVLCFFGDVVTDVVSAHPDARRLTSLVSEAGRNPVWEIDVSGRHVAVVQPGVGAPMAAAFCEELIAMGARKLIACGGAGVLVPNLALGHAVIVEGAVRDEGTSHHYLPVGRIVEADTKPRKAITRALEAAGLAHTTGRSWTTDAIYRETRPRVARRIAEGCLTVEMEAAALLAVTRYRRVHFGQVLLAADSLAGETWDDRGWMSAGEARRSLFRVAAEAAAWL